jgi:molecular chaperone DnaK (HSP70)/tetratricopeptide (TPR) repeat protein
MTPAQRAARDRRPTSRAYFGIDYGTTYSSIAYVTADPRNVGQRVPVYVVEVPEGRHGRRKSPLLPSLIAQNVADRRTRRVLMGWELFDALLGRRSAIEPLRHGVNLFRSVKSDMGSNCLYTWAFDAAYNTPAKVSAAILRKLIDVAREEKGYDVRQGHAVITVPASFSALARRETLEAAELAGLDRERVELLDEPIAALLDLMNHGDAARCFEPDRFSNVLIFDYGGGTCDLTLVRARFDIDRATGIHAEPLAISAYRRLGGDDVDRAIMADVIWPQIEEHIGRHRGSLGVRTRTQIEDTLTWTVARQLKEAVCKAVADEVRRGARAWGRVGRMATQPEQAPVIAIPELRPRGLPRGYSLSPAQLMTSMEPFLSVPRGEVGTMRHDYPRSLLVPIFETLERGGLTRDDLDVLVLHGGACRNPFVRRFLEQEVGNRDDLFARTRVVMTPDLDSSVASGAAVAAYWSGERGVRPVRPIIADDVGVLAANDAPIVLLRRGTTLPFPGEGALHTEPTEFYVARDGQRELLVPVFSGEPARLAGSVKVTLPPRARKGDVVRIKLQVDEDKQLSWWFNIGDAHDVDARSLHDPCTEELPSPERQRLLDHRRTMRERADDGEAPSVDALLQEALLVLRWAERDGGAARKHDAGLLIDDIFDRRITDVERFGRAWNIRGLILSSQGRFQDAEEAYRRAAAIGGDAVHVANHGTALLNLGRIDEAIAAFRSALSKDPSLVYVYEWLGDVYRHQGNEAAAVNEFQEGLMHAVAETKRHPRWREAWERRAWLHRAIGEYDHAASAEQTLASLQRDEDYRGDSRDMLGILWPRDR